MRFLSLTRFWVSLWFGSVLCHWCQVTHPKILPNPFHLSAKVEKSVFVQSKLIYVLVQVMFTFLSHMGQGLRQAGSIHTLAKPAFAAFLDSKLFLKLSKQKQV